MNNRIAIGALLAVFATAAAGDAGAAAPSTAPSSASAWNGVWLFDRADADFEKDDVGKWRPMLSTVWDSQVTIRDGAFNFSHWYGISKNVKGTILLNPAGPGSVDLKLEYIDLGEMFAGVSYPACTLPGIYQIEGGQLLLCVQSGSKYRRPTDFNIPVEGTLLIRLVKADADFKGFSNAVAVSVIDRGGKPVPGASICSYMERHRHKNPKDKMTYGYDDIAKSDANGIARVSYDDLSKNSVLVRDEAHKRMGIASVTPVSLEKLAVTVQLQPECLLTGKIERGVLPGGGENAMWTNVILEYGGEQIAACESFSGDYEFHLPPGDYSLFAYGDQTPKRCFSITVPVGPSAMEAKPIALIPSHLGTLVGKPAMELDGVVGWKGTPTKLADCKGKYVLLDFWGYWCHPCVQLMPNVMELYDRFKDTGLVVIGVHVDDDGEVATADQLDARLVQTRKQLWAGKDIPFPIALVHGDQLLASKQYGVFFYPTTILIDRSGNIVGEFDVHDKDEAIAKIEKLLADPK